VELVKQWEHHKIMNKWMFRFFMYLVCARAAFVVAAATTRAHCCRKTRAEPLLS
jgi:hypothetical protein